MVNVFGGKGFIGSRYVELYPDVIVNDRDDYVPKTQNILYFISTIDNYNVFTDPHLDINTNLNTLITVLENIPKDQRQHTVFNFISSWFVYGDVELPATETSPCHPTGFYSITKRTAEQLLISYCKTFGIQYRILRLGNVMGPNDPKASRKKNALTFLLHRLKNHEPVQLYGNGEVYRDLIDVDDCVRAINLVLTKGKLNDIYNIGNGWPIHIGSFIDIAKFVYSSTSNITSIDPPDFHKIVQTHSMYLDITKLKQLGYVPQYSVYDIIRRAVHE